jgi:hypothetical protein
VCFNFDFRWRGSVYKLVWRELLTYLTLYYSINFVYRYALNDNQKRYVRLYSIHKSCCVTQNNVHYKRSEDLWLVIVVSTRVCIPLVILSIFPSVKLSFNGWIIRCVRWKKYSNWWSQKRFSTLRDSRCRCFIGTICHFLGGVHCFSCNRILKSVLDISEKKVSEDKNENR